MLQILHFSLLLMTCGGLNLLQSFCSFPSFFSSPLEPACLEGAEEVEGVVDVGEDGSPPAPEDLLMEATAAAAAAAPPLELQGAQGLLIQYSLLQDATGRSLFKQMQKRASYSYNQIPMSGPTLSLHLQFPLKDSDVKRSFPRFYFG